MSITDKNPMMYLGGKVIEMKVTAARIENSAPSAYRLMEKKDGSLVLQGAYNWSQGMEGGHEWRDVPTVKEQPSPQYKEF